MQVLEKDRDDARRSEKVARCVHQLIQNVTTTRTDYVTLRNRNHNHKERLQPRPNLNN